MASLMMPLRLVITFLDSAFDFVFSKPSRKLSTAGRVRRWGNPVRKRPSSTPELPPPTTSSSAEPL